jgi:serine/threonine-protein kinase
MDVYQIPTHCPECQRELPEKARYCPLCGANLRKHLQASPGTGLLAPGSVLRGQRGYYTIERRLAQGGQSAVYLATDATAGGDRRAIKEMSQAGLLPHERERAINHFFREAQMLSQFDHPNLARVYEHFVDGDKHYLAMEYVPGHTLEDEMIELGRPLEWEPVVRWSITLCDVLGYLHAQRPPIIYRDLKPANVMLTPNGELKLIDFGIARRLLPARMRDTAQLGTDGYAPLEQYASQSESRSDLYALGASLYHLLTGRVPESAPVRSTGGKFATPREINPRVPEPVERVTMRALSLAPEDRYVSAQALAEALAQLLPNAPLPAAPQPAVAQLGVAQLGAVRPVAEAGKMTARSANAPAAPKLHVWPLRLDGGSVDAGNDIPLELEIGNRGGGELTGKVETNAESLHVDPMRITDETTHLRVRVDTANLMAGGHVYHLAVRTNGGDQIVPVRFTVQATVQIRRGR